MKNIANKSPIFIVGAPRSGTTLISQMLSRHADVFIYNETVFYDFIISSGIHEDTEESSELIIDYLINRLDFTQSKETDEEFGCVITSNDVDHIVRKINERRKDLIQYHNSKVFSSIMSIISEHKGKEIWGEKTPNHIFHLQRIISDYPDAKIIHIIRNPEKFLLSYKYMWRQSGSKNPTNAKKLYNPYVTSKLWIKSTEAFNKFARRNVASFIEARYEDLVNSPESELSRICKFIDIDYQDRMLAIKGSNTSFKSHKEELSEWELIVCDTLTKQYKLQYQYDVRSYPRHKKVIAFIKAYTLLPKFLISALPVVLGYFKGGAIKYLKSRAILFNGK